MKLYITGASGFLGTMATKYFQNHGYDVLTNRVEIVSLPTLKQRFREIKPDVVFNLASAVRNQPNIDWCENNKVETIEGNLVGAINVMLAAIASSAYPIQMSSGCVYSGGPETPFTEESEPNYFGSFYSRMKIVLQEALKELPILQTRIRMPIFTYHHPKNLITKLASYKKVVDNVSNSITLLEDLWPALEKLFIAKPVGILNLTNEGYVTHRNILQAYRKVIDRGHSYEPLTVSEFEKSGLTKARRSACVLSNTKAKSLGITMPPLDERRLEEIMTTYKRSLEHQPHQPSDDQN